MINICKCERGEPVSPAKSYKRRNIFIYKSLQVKFTLLVVFLFAMAGFAVWWEAMHSLSVFTSFGFGDAQVKAVAAEFNKILLIKMLIELGLIVVLCLIFSHFIAGPLYRIQEAMKAVGEGDFSVRLRFRRLDELKRLGAAFNDMMDQLESHKRR